jgi:hypothetical protein
MPPETQSAEPSQQEVHDAFGVLYQELTNAYWVASTIEVKDRIRGIADSVFDILTQLNQAEIQSRTADFAALSKNVAAVSARLDSLKEDLDQIIHVVAVATSVSTAIDKALTVASTFFTL